MFKIHLVSISKQLKLMHGTDNKHLAGQVQCDRGVNAATCFKRPIQRRATPPGCARPAKQRLTAIRSTRGNTNAEKEWIASVDWIFSRSNL